MHMDLTYTYACRYMYVCNGNVSPRTHVCIHSCWHTHSYRHMLAHHACVWPSKQPQRIPRSRSQGLWITEWKPGWTQRKRRGLVAGFGQNASLGPSKVTQDATVLCSTWFLKYNFIHHICSFKKKNNNVDTCLFKLNFPSLWMYLGEQVFLLKTDLSEE